MFHSAHLARLAPAPDAADDVALGDVHRQRRQHISSDQHAPVARVDCQQDGEVKGVRAPREARLQQDPLCGAATF